MTITYFSFYLFIGVDAQGRERPAASWADLTTAVLQSGPAFCWVGGFSVEFSWLCLTPSPAVVSNFGEHRIPWRAVKIQTPSLMMRRYRQEVCTQALELPSLTTSPETLVLRACGLHPQYTPCHWGAPHKCLMSEVGSKEPTSLSLPFLYSFLFAVLSFSFVCALFCSLERGRNFLVGS